MYRKIFTRVSVCAATAAVFIVCAAAAPAATELNLQDMNGKAVNLSDYKGKVIILDFFATWCPPCKQEIPDFVELQKEYGDQGFTMIGVSLSGASDMRKFASRHGINYPVLMDSRKVQAAYGPVRSIPTTLVLDQNMNVVKQYIGYKPKSVFEADITTLLNKNKNEG